MLAEILNLCTSRDLTFVHDFVCPRLKRDPFAELPDELSLRVWKLNTMSAPTCILMLTTEPNI